MTSFMQSGKVLSSHRILIGDIVNFHSKNKDTFCKKIRSGLYLAFEEKIPDIKLMDETESLAGISYKGTVIIKGSYEPKGKYTTIRLKAIKDRMKGKLLAQTKVDFETQKVSQKTLVAVLDLEGEMLSKNMRKAFSEIFRAALSKTDSFEIASSAEVDKYSPDKVQKSNRCTRDECAVIIGEQMGVDRVVSTSLIDMNQGKFLISSKMIDIRSSSIVISLTSTHSKGLGTLDVSLNKLANKLINGLDRMEKKVPAIESLTSKTSTSDMEKEMWNMVLESNNIEEDIQGFLELYPYGKFAPEAKQRLEDVLLNRLKNTNSIAELREFLKKEQNPYRKFAPMAKWKLEGILWNQVKVSNNPSDINEFLKELPDGRFASKAKSKLRKMANEMWNQVKNSEDADDIQNFLLIFPDSQFSSTAQTALLQIESKEAEEKAEEELMSKQGLRLFLPVYSYINFYIPYFSSSEYLEEAALEGNNPVLGFKVEYILPWKFLLAYPSLNFSYRQFNFDLSIEAKISQYDFSSHSIAATKYDDSLKKGKTSGVMHMISQGFSLTSFPFGPYIMFAGGFHIMYGFAMLEDDKIDFEGKPTDNITAYIDYCEISMTSFFAPEFFLGGGFRFFENLEIFYRFSVYSSSLIAGGYVRPTCVVKGTTEPVDNYKESARYDMLVHEFSLGAGLVF